MPNHVEVFVLLEARVDIYWVGILHPQLGRLCASRKAMTTQKSLLVFITDNNFRRKGKTNTHLAPETENSSLKSVASALPVAPPHLRRMVVCDEKFILCIMDVVSLFDILFDPFWQIGDHVMILIKRKCQTCRLMTGTSCEIQDENKRLASCVSLNFVILSASENHFAGTSVQELCSSNRSFSIRESLDLNLNEVANCRTIAAQRKTLLEFLAWKVLNTRTSEKR